LFGLHTIDLNVKMSPILVKKLQLHPIFCVKY
jgi:hypothetical protein